ncbi:hypothetical protein LSCM1_08158 [Leishmania martiniquensis]|uniref:Uncharacterized protein n=1 Tax=Leishmania martiniquensis TaxID=1580590 RepID=A0A836HB01_9TRYP|nr:hypothetical protein LSCM1_08158 [Leishmania martiniquensis]
MKRSGSGQPDSVTRLTAKGYSKAKATQALKDAGNNFEVALRILERQRDQQQQQQPRARAHGTDGACASSSTASAAIPSLHRTKPPPTSALFAGSPAAEAVRRQRQRCHPCVVQFGSCQYGQFCVLKDVPGDVCVQHFQGCCVYGSACRHRHTIDGVDVREYVWGPSKDGDSAAVLRSGDSVYRVRAVDGMGSKVQSAEPMGDQANADKDGDDDTLCGEGASRRQRATAPPLASDFNRIRGSVPSHTDPMLPSALRAVEGEAGETEESAGLDAGGGDARSSGPAAVTVVHPTPFRDLVKSTSADAAAQPPPSRPPHSSSLMSAAPAAAPASRGRARHPCIAQYGSCMFGDACAHADRDADVCVHFLNRRCRYSAEDCRYRHETEAEYHAALLARIAPQGPKADAPGSADECKERRYTHKSANRLQGGLPRTVTEFESGRDTSSSDPSPLPALPSVKESVAPPEPLQPSDGAVASHDEGSDADSDRARGAPEMYVFLGLLEAFPDVEPAVVLQALRVSGGDPIRASDVIAHVGAVSTTAEVDDVAAVLALAAADEASERESAGDAAATAALERHNALLTLAFLFPAIEPAALEAVLSQHHGAFSEAYSALLCAQENVARSAIWSGSTATMTPADRLRIEKLCVMFPSLDADVVRSAYCAADRQWSRAITALNALTEELLSLDSSVRTASVPAKTAAAATVVWRPPHPARAATTVAAGDAANATAAPPAHEETAAEAFSAYREAEHEIIELGDWRRVREQAYLMNTQRLRVLGQATAAFLNGDGRTAKLLSNEGRRLGLEYNRLNRMAMLALEQERLRTDATSTLDLHGFHTAEVHDVLVRRVRVCQHHRISHLRIVTGEGKHSRRGHQSLYPVVMEDLRTDSFLTTVLKVRSIKAGYIDAAVRLPTAEF